MKLTTSDSELIRGQLWLSCDEIMLVVVLNMVSSILIR